MDVCAVVCVGAGVEVSVVPDVGRCYIVSRAFATTSDAEGCLLVVGPSGEQFVEPVHIRVHKRICSCFGLCDLLVSEDLFPAGLVVKTHVVRTVQKFRHVREFRDTAFDLHIDLCLLGDALSGRDENYTVRSAHTVNGSRRGILEDGNRLYLLDGKVGHVALNTVHEDERRAGVQRGDSTDPELGVVHTRLTGPLDDNSSGHLAGEGVGKVALRNLQFGVGHRGDGSDHGSPSLMSHADHDGLFQFSLVVLKEDVKFQGFRDGDSLSLVTHACDLQLDSGSGDLDRVVTIDVGHGSGLGAGDEDCRSRHWLSCAVDDLTFDRDLVLGCDVGRALFRVGFACVCSERRNRQQCGQHDESYPSPSHC